MENHPPGSHPYWAAKVLIGLCGELHPSSLTARHIETINSKIAASISPFTKRARAGALRRVLRKLYEDSGASRLEESVCRVPTPRPRNVTATEEERRALLDNATPHLRCWLLMCSDLAIRSGTAAIIAPQHYDAKRKELTFSTKYQNRQKLPVTDELAGLLGTPGLNPLVPYVAQLPRGAHLDVLGRKYIYRSLGRMHPESLRNAYIRLRKKCGITRKLTPHDLRRTTASRVYELTHDLRLVQALLGHSDLNSTLWYLDHHITPVDRPTLELAKLNPETETIQ